MSSFLHVFKKDKSYLEHTNLHFMREANQERFVSGNKAAAFNMTHSMDAIEKKLNVANICYLTSGGFGTIWLATEANKSIWSKMHMVKKSPESTLVALKVVPTQYISPKLHKIWYNRALREVYFLRKLQHKHIVAFHDHIFLAPNGETVPHWLIIKTEYLDRDVLEVTKKRSLTLLEMARMADQVGEAISWMHSKRIIHHDLKPANIMAHPINNLENAYLERALKTVCYKVIDFNIAKKYPKKPASETLEYYYKGGSVYYMCAEKANAYQHKPYNPYLADAYAYGVTLLATLMGQNKLANSFDQYKSMPDVLGQFTNKLSTAEQERHQGLITGLQSLLAAEATRIFVDGLKMFNKNN